MARSGCIYGPTGSRKTTQGKWLAHYIANTTGKSTYLLSMDGGGWSACQPEIDVGMIEPFRIDPALVPLPTLRKISQGYWPRDSKKPTAEIDLVQMDFTKFGGIIVEGWTSISAAVMRYLPDKGVNVGGEEREKLGGFTQTIRVNGLAVNEVFRSSTRGDYGYVQNFLYGLVMNFNALPLDYVLYTALEAKTEDDDRSTIFGPSISGKKATAQCGAWVGDLIHAQDYPVERIVKVPDPSKPGQQMEQKYLDVDVRFYYKKHPDPATGIFFPAKPRVTPERVRDLEKAFPGGYFESTETGGFDNYLAKVDAFTVGQADTLRDWRKQADARLGRVPPMPMPADAAVERPANTIDPTSKLLRRV